MEYRAINIIDLIPYTSARDIFTSGTFLDANENYAQWVKIDWTQIRELNRYPESNCLSVRTKLVEKYLTGFSTDNIFVGSGSDEIIDLLIRAFVNIDEYVLVLDPSYSVYEVQCEINNRQVKKLRLKPDFSLDLDAIKKNLAQVKMIFLCSPNNPTGNLLQRSELDELMKIYKGLIVIDEAYIEYAGLENSFVELVKANPNVIILRTFSKAWGLAAIRAGYCVADQLIIETLLKVKNSYNVSKITQGIVIQALDQTVGLKNAIAQTMRNKGKLEKQLQGLGFQIIPTAANFILVRIPDAKKVYEALAARGLIVRDRSNLPYLENVLRVTVGSAEENNLLVSCLKP